VNLRRLNSEGVSQFAAYLGNLRVDSHIAPPFQILDDPVTSEPIEAEVEIENRMPAVLQAHAHWAGHDVPR
jgi:hypothetical protein